MAFDDIIDRDDASALMPEEVQREIIEGTIEKSAALALMEHQPMTRRQSRIPVLSVLPSAYFVETQNDTGLKQTTRQAWSNKYLNAEEIAAIVVMPENVLSDSEFDAWAKIKPRISEAFALKLDGAVFFGTDKPATWATDIVTAAIAAGNSVVEGTSTIDLGDDINLAMQTVEADGFEVTGFWGRTQMKGALRGIRGNFGQLLFYSGDQGISDAKATPSMLWGEPIEFSKAGLTGFGTGSGKAELIAGDFKQAIIGIREDISMKVFTEGVITDENGNVVINLMQQDSVALRATARYAFQVPNPINRAEETEANRYPFSVLLQA